MCIQLVYVHVQVLTTTCNYVLTLYITHYAIYYVTVVCVYVYHYSTGMYVSICMHVYMYDCMHIYMNE